MATATATRTGSTHRKKSTPLDSYYLKCAGLIDQLRTAYADNLRQIGTVLLSAATELTSEQAAELEERLLTMLTRHDLKAAKALARNEVDPKLFYAGVSSAKIMRLNNDDKKKLLSGQKLEIRKADNSVVRKPWDQMSSFEKDQVLGSKGSAIHKVHEQKILGERRPLEPLAPTAMTYADKTLNLRAGYRAVQISAACFAQQLSPAALSTFIADLTRLSVKVK
jgi:hypothetical protein